MSTILPFAVGESTTSAQAAGDLGRLYNSNGKFYRVVKTASSLSAPGSKVLVSAMSAGAPTYVVDTSIVLADVTVAGIVPAVYTATLAASTYFLIQVHGPATVLCANTTQAATSPICMQTASVAGQAQAIASGIDASIVVTAGFGRFTNTAVATAIGGAVSCVIHPLL